MTWPRYPGRETRSSLDWLLDWQHADDWLDPVDGFDYAAALEALPPPPSLYLINERASLSGRVEDCRRWISEMGAHDARIVSVGRRGGNQRNYSHRELVQHPAAVDDHFLQIGDWLQERIPSFSPSSLASKARAEES